VTENADSKRPEPESRARYRHFLVIPTRWMDNDVYGHVNNVVYYSYFDTVINRYLIDAGGLDIHGAPVIGIAVETTCRFHAPIAFPEAIDAGLRVGHLGRTSVRYEVGLFKAGQDEAAAAGHFVHVFVERAASRPVEIPSQIRTALERLLA
jgi:acyl-CoA thioester hydrolase